MFFLEEKAAYGFAACLVGSGMCIRDRVVVIEGTKEVLWGAEQRVYGPGEAIALGAGAHVDVVNVPDEASGVYRALCVTFPRDLVIEAARLGPGPADARAWP